MNMLPNFLIFMFEHALGVIEKGIEPHIQISWTPNHIETDVDMQAALNLLEKKKFTK